MASSAAEDVVVANPGGLRWLGHAAAGLGRAGRLREYLAPFVFTAEQEQRVRRWLPPPLARALLRELRRRTLPAGIAPEAVRRAASASELLFVAAGRLGLPDPVTHELMDRRARRFDRAVSQRLSHEDSAVVASWNAALSTLRRARSLDVATFLDYPIVHHRYARDLLSGELSRAPAYADTLQFHQLPAGQERRLNAEIECCDRVLLQTEFQRHTFTAAGIDESRLEVIPFGVDSELFRPRARADDGVFRVLFGGQLTQRKGLSYAVEGFSRAGLPDAELVLQGGVVGRSRPWSSVPNVRHVGHLPYEEQPTVLATADVFLFPSLAEGFPQTPLQAMASGLPVVVSENTFGPGVVADGEQGFVVPIRDPDAIAERLRALHASEGLRRRLGRAARELGERYSWEAYGAGVVQAIDRGRA
ncbi:MAG TPA: glycosyltransferase family 4 protein [Solirubrobacteraceae bacterium]|jgi:glycosyltransferase involved in cell wall biosynthesis|nr:glycosyltransferase family 4 protein [Solirubrobacteraceae bacterium]